MPGECIYNFKISLVCVLAIYYEGDMILVLLIYNPMKLFGIRITLLWSVGFRSLFPYSFFKVLDVVQLKKKR